MTARTIISVSFVLHGETAQTAMERYLESRPGNDREAARRIALLCDKLAQGQAIGKMFVDSDEADGTVAAGSIACTQANALAGDTLTLGDATFTVRASPSTNPGLGEFAAGASDTAMGDNLAAAINRHPKLKGLGAAVAVTGTVTYTFTDKGLHGHRMKMTETGTSMALTQAASGVHGTVKGKMRAHRFGV